MIVPPESDGSLEAGGFVLAGGRSRRMGQDKALFHFEGTPLIERALGKLREVAAEVSIAGDRPDLSRFATLIEDRCQGCGPLGGIQAALASSNYDLNVFLPVDAPFVPAYFLGWMLSRALCSGAVATIPIVNGHPQPLIAVYSRRLLPELTSAITDGRLKTIDAVVQASFHHGGADLFRVEITSPFFPPRRDFPHGVNIGRWFENLNTLEDVDRARA